MGSKDIADSMLGIFGNNASDHNQYGVDWITVYDTMDKVFSVGGMVIQLLATIIAIMFTLTVCLELLYITLPLVRENLENLGDRKESIKNVYKVTLGDARKAVEIANTVKTGRQAVQVYLGLKIKQFIIVAISLWLAFNISDFISLILNIVGPITDALRKIMTGQTI